MKTAIRLTLLALAALFCLSACDDDTNSRTQLNNSHWILSNTSRSGRPLTLTFYEETLVVDYASAQTPPFDEGGPEWDYYITPDSLLYISCEIEYVEDDYTYTETISHRLYYSLSNNDRTLTLTYGTRLGDPTVYTFVRR